MVVLIYVLGAVFAACESVGVVSVVVTLEAIQGSYYSVLGILVCSYLNCFMC